MKYYQMIQLFGLQFVSLTFYFLIITLYVILKIKCLCLNNILLEFIFNLTHNLLKHRLSYLNIYHL